MASTEVINNNDFDFGVCTDDLSIKIVTISDNKIHLNSNEFINPFFVKLNVLAPSEMTPVNVIFPSVLIPVSPAKVMFPLMLPAPRIAPYRTRFARQSR